MSFFKNLFGKSKPESSKPDPKPHKPLTDPEFEAAFDEAMLRYYFVPGGEIKTDLEDHDGSPLSFTQAFPETYLQWKAIQSPWDKRRLIFDTLDDSPWGNLKMWQTIERIIQTRDTEFLFQKIEKGDFDGIGDEGDPDLQSALARFYYVRGLYENGIERANKALEIDPECKKAKIMLADLLHLKGDHNQAHKIYEAALEESNLKEMGQTIDLLDIVGFHSDVLYSPVYAVGILQSLDKSALEAWDVIAGEFYWCPYFRSQHAFAQINAGNVPHALGKLVTLAQEMPWFKDGVINAYGVIKQLGMLDSLKKEVEYLEAIISENGWETP